VSRVIIAFDLNLYLPISLVDDNMERAHMRDATQTQKFWWRRHMAPPAESDCKADTPGCCKVHSDYDSYEEMSCLEILTGKGKYFPGLLPMIEAYLDTIGLDSQTRKSVDNQLQFLQARAAGEIMTAATWMRKFVTSHPEYKNDSVVTSGIAYDLLKECHEISEGLKACPDLLGTNVVAPMPAKDRLYDKPLNSEKKHDRQDVQNLISRYAERADLANKKRKLNRDIIVKEDELVALKAELAGLADSDFTQTPVLGSESGNGEPSEMKL